MRGASVQEQSNRVGKGRSARGAVARDAGQTLGNNPAAKFGAAWLAAIAASRLVDGETYSQRIQPRLAGIAYSEIAAALGVSLPYAAAVRAGQRVPHPRHWVKLAELIGVGM